MTDLAALGPVRLDFPFGRASAAERALLDERAAADKARGEYLWWSHWWRRLAVAAEEGRKRRAARERVGPAWYRSMLRAGTLVPQLVQVVDCAPRARKAGA